MMLGTHPEYNEDRKCTDHPGYAAFLCDICKQPTLKARTSPARTCGRMECMTLAGDVLAKGRA